MIAMLDTWESPQYCTRIWTVFEQFTAAKLKVEVKMILPPKQMESFKAECRSSNVSAVTQNLTQIDVENAKASVPKDEETVKALIQQHSSFDAVNKAVKDSMSNWCGEAFKEFLKSDQASGSPGEAALSLEDENAQLKAMVAQLEGENTQYKG